MKNLSEAPLKGRPLAGALATNKLERLARDKHSGLLRKFVTCGGEKFYNIVPRANVIKLFTDIIYE